VADQADEFAEELEQEHGHEHAHYEEDERDTQPHAHGQARAYQGHTSCTWRALDLGTVTLLVSSTGAVRHIESNFWNVHYGVVVQGTPYRSVTVREAAQEADYTYAHYMHELVWRAFHGHIPEGWFVGHKVDEWRHLGSAGEVSNALSSLELYEKRVTPL